MRKLYLIATVVAISLVACNKKSDLVGNTDLSVSQNAPKNIMRFDSYEALSLEIDRSLERASLPVMMRAKGETNGFVSFGTLADMAYEDIALMQDEYKSIEEVRAAVAKYPDYLQLIQDENGEYEVVEILENSSTRYIVNEDKMFQVQTDLVKTLDNYIVTTSVQNYKELLSVSERNIDSYRNNSEFTITDNFSLESSAPQPNLGKDESFEQVKKMGGRDHRLRIKFYLEKYWADDNKNHKELRMCITHHRKGKWNLIYWQTKTNLNWNVSAMVWGLYYCDNVWLNSATSPYGTGTVYAWKHDIGIHKEMAMESNPVITKTRGYVKSDNGLYVNCDKY